MQRASQGIFPNSLLASQNRKTLWKRKRNRTGNFRKDFINNLSFLSSPDTPINQRGVGIIGLAITSFFSQYGFPNPNSIRIAKKNIKNSTFELYI